MLQAEFKFELVQQTWMKIYYHNSYPEKSQFKKNSLVCMCLVKHRVEPNKSLKLFTSTQKLPFGDSKNRGKNTFETVSLA